MLVVSSSDIHGKEITGTLDLVKGTTVCARSMVSDLIAWMRNAIGGEVHEYTKILAESREHALDRMKEKAEEGKILIWPSEWMHLHRGIPSPTQTKYILTGWFSFKNNNKN